LGLNDGELHIHPLVRKSADDGAVQEEALHLISDEIDLRQLTGLDQYLVDAEGWKDEAVVDVGADQKLKLP
jgi:hypothetical protein